MQSAAQNIAARPPKVRRKRRLRILDAQLTVEPLPALKMRRVRIDQHAVHIEDHGEVRHDCPSNVGGVSDADLTATTWQSFQLWIELPYALTVSPPAIVLSAFSVSTSIVER